MQVRLLGPVDVTVGGCPSGAGLRRKAVLAALALHAGDVVSTDRLIDIVWGGGGGRQRSTPCSATSPTSAACWATRPRSSPSPGLPAGPRRRAHGRRGRGAAGRAGPGSATTRRAARPTARRWPVAGPAAGRRGRSGLVRPAADRLERLRMVAVEGLFDARLALGEAAGLVPELEALARRHPFQESVHRQLMLALYRSGRQADALAAVPAVAGPARRGARHRARAPRCASCRRRSCARTPGSTRHRHRLPPAVPAPHPATPLPAQLPLAVPGFAGRRGRARPPRRRPRRATGAGRRPPRW